MRPGYKVIYAALMRRLDRHIMDAIVENKGWAEVFEDAGLTYEAKGN